MKKHTFILAALFCILITPIYAQNETVKAQLATPKVQNDVRALLNSNNFEFVANTVFPLGQPPKNLVGSDYTITFSPKMVISNMPYYGRAYSTPMGRDKGMRFKGAPEIFTVSTKGSPYSVQTTVTNEKDTYSISLEVEASGYATLGIATNNRQTITYHGEVVALKN